MPKQLTKKPVVRVRVLDEVIEELRRHPTVPVWVVATLAAIQSELQNAIIPAALRAAGEETRDDRLHRAMANLSCVAEE